MAQQDAAPATATSPLRASAKLSSAPLSSMPARHPELDKLEREGGKVEFIGHSYGLDGWLLITKEGQAKYAYTNTEGGLVLGMLVGPDGKIKTTDQLKAYKNRLDGSQAALPGADDAATSKVEKFYAEVERANWLTMGKSDAPYLYLFANVNCEHCQGLWKDLEPAVKAGTLQVRFVPFGKQPLNRDGGAALLSANDPLLTWTKYVAGEKNLLAKEYAFKGAYEKVDANTALVNKWKVQGPPFTVYRRPQDGVVTAVVGKPDNAMLITADLMKKE